MYFEILNINFCLNLKGNPGPSGEKGEKGIIGDHGARVIENSNFETIFSMQID